MTLYLYRIGDTVPCLTIEHAVSYTDAEVTAVINDETVVYAPLAEDCELSTKQNCSETLRADWRSAHPSVQLRIEELETLMAELLFGAEKGGAAE